MERLKYDEKLCESSPCPKSENTMIDLVEEEDSAAREEYVLHQAKINQDIQVYFMKQIFYVLMLIQLMKGSLDFVSNNAATTQDECCNVNT